jgi:hypothetical protein
MGTPQLATWFKPASKLGTQFWRAKIDKLAALSNAHVKSCRLAFVAVLPCFVLRAS